MIVPLSNLIIFTGILSLLLSPLPFAGEFSVTILRVLVSLMNNCVSWIGHLPGSVSRGFFPGITDVLLIYGIILAACLFLLYRKKGFLAMVIILLVISEVSSITGKLNRSGRCSIAIHRSVHGFVIRILKGPRELCLYSGTGAMNDSYLSEQIRNERLAEKVRTVYPAWIRSGGWRRIDEFKDVGNCGRILIVRDHKIWLIDGDISPGLHAGLHADIVLITRPGRIRMKTLKNILSPGIVLNASSSPHKMVLKWKDEAKSLKMKFYDLKATGFYREEI
jgi:competence protein ComEC